jgi:hypothetical protein
VRSSYPPLNLQVRTPRLVLAGATDELLERLIPVVRVGVVGAGPVLYLAFAGLAAREAASEAFADNQASNRVSEALGYEPDGTSWATRRGDAAPLKRWKLTRERWETTRRTDIELVGVQECLPVLGV